MAEQPAKQGKAKYSKVKNSQKQMGQICPPPIAFYLDKLVMILSIIERGMEEMN